MITILCLPLSFLLSTLATWFLIPALYQIKFGQPVLAEAPESHKKKQGVPTMGGIAFISVISLLGLSLMGVTQSHVFVILGMLLMGILGFVDDGIKVILKRNLGLRASYKLLGQILIALLLAFLVKNKASSVLIPFTSQLLDLGYFYYPLVVVFILAMTNGTNLTDGLDGLLSSVSIVVILFFVLISWQMGHQNLLRLSLIFLGALAGFLVFNRYPARIIMGDTGSMAIGGFLSVLMLLTRTPLYALIVGVIFVVESLSVIIQVFWFKRTGRRVFRMAPLHHHFEMLGYPEQLIVLMFVAISLLALVVGLLVYWV